MPHPLPFWVQQINTAQGARVGLIAQGIQSALQQLDRDGPLAVDADLLQVDFTQANDVHLVAVLRALRPARNDLPHWGYALDQCRLLLDSKGLDSNGILKGLDASVTPPSPPSTPRQQ